MKQNYLQLLVDKDYLFEWGCTFYDALRGKEDELDELIHELGVTMESLEGAQLAFHGSQS